MVIHQHALQLHASGSRNAASAVHFNELNVRSVVAKHAMPATAQSRTQVQSHQKNPMMIDGMCLQWHCNQKIRFHGGAKINVFGTKS